MSDALFFSALGLVALAGVIYEMQRDPDSEFQARYTHELGWQQAAIGLGRNDYPIDYEPAEVEAWQAGWDEYHEDRS